MYIVICERFFEQLPAEFPTYICTLVDYGNLEHLQISVFVCVLDDIYQKRFCDVWLVQIHLSLESVSDTIKNL
jgi:hypothetical protein